MLMHLRILIKKRMERFRQQVNSSRIVEEQHSAVCSAKKRNTRNQEVVEGRSADFWRDGGGVVSESVVFGTKEKDAAAASDIEGGGAVFDAFVDERGYAGLGDGGGVGERVD
jgi:hypothetical protein